MGRLICHSCNKEFFDENEQKIHYKSEWHRYNLKRKVAKVPGLTETLFIARQSALAQEMKRLSRTPLLYCCVHCGKQYTSSKAHAQHLESKTHLSQASRGTGHHDESSLVIKPLPCQPEDRSGSDESEWEEVDEANDDSLREIKINRSTRNDAIKAEGRYVDEYIDELDPRCCFMCDLEHDTVESCTVHMHKQHGFFIPDIEYLKDPKGFLTYLGLKVKRDHVCLYCNDRRHPFSSLEAVRKHMESKCHCKVHYGDGGNDEEAELEEFYDYSSSYVDATGKQLVSSQDFNINVELGNGGSELIITRRTSDRLSVKTIGSREFLRYYRQKLRPTCSKDTAIKVSPSFKVLKHGSSNSAIEGAHR